MNTLQVRVEAYVAVVTLNHPPVNAQTPEMWSEIAATFDELGARDDVRVTILTGAGRVFSAGADIRRQQEAVSAAETWRRLRAAREATYAVLEHKRPVIVAINGAAAGLGVSLIACCDILLCSESASLSLPELNVGLLGGARHAMRILPHSALRHLFFTGRTLDAREMYRRGIVESCVPAEKLMATAMDIATNIAAKSPVAVRMAKETLGAIETMTLRDGYRLEQDKLVELAGTADSREAMAAFVEKRVATFNRSLDAV